MDSDVVNVGDLTVIQVKACKKSKTCRCLYLKEHAVTETHPSKPTGKTLLVLNVPPYATESGLAEVFSECGAVKHVILQPKPSSGPPPDSTSDSQNLFAHRPPTSKGFQVAYVIFKDKNSLLLAKKMPYARERFLSSEDNPFVTGLQKYRNAYIASQPPNPEKLKSQVDKYMEEYDKRVEEEKVAAKEIEGVPDDEGWIKVTRQGRTKGTPHTDAHEQRIKKKLRKRNQEKELLHFYKFQVRESKKQQLTELREKFEQDKQKIAEMRAARKFRPY